MTKALLTPLTTCARKAWAIIKKAGPFILLIARNWRLAIAVAGFLGAGAVAFTEQLLPLMDAIAAWVPYV